MWEGISAILNATNNIAIIILILMVVFLGWLLVTARKDEREDRNKLLTSIDTNTKALSDLRIALAAQTGRTN